MRLKLLFVLLVFFSILLIMGCNNDGIDKSKSNINTSNRSNSNQVNNSEDYIIIGGKNIVIEIADTDEEREKGLMGVDNLCETCGMLFVFENQGEYSFWMKNTLIPLDMLFVDNNSRVVDVLHAVPCIEDPCTIYTPKDDATYVLEVNGNTFDESIVGEEVKIIIQK